MIRIEDVIARIPSWRAARVSVSPLSGGITNLNYRVDVNGDVFVVAIAGPGTERLGIDRHRAYQCTLTASRTGVGPEVVHWLPDDGILVTRWIAGRRLTSADIGRPEPFAQVVRSLHRYHAGPAFAGRFSPFRTVDDYVRIARAHRAPLPDDFEWMADQAARIEAAVGSGDERLRPCHNDLWEFNLIDDGTLVRIIDWEYAGMGDVYFDLANFATHNALSDAGDDRLLRAYFGEASPPGAARLGLLKIVAELREAMWAMVALDLAATAASGFDCVGYARTHFDRCRQALRDRRLPVWLGALSQG